MGLIGLDAALASFRREGQGSFHLHGEVHAASDRRTMRDRLTEALYRRTYCDSRVVADSRQLVEALRASTAAASRVGGGAGARGSEALHRHDAERRIFHVCGSTREWERPRLRFYFHIAPAEAAPLVGSLTARLERWCVPFRFKTPAFASMYGRRDTAVLYVEWFRFQFVLELIRDAMRAREFRLESPTPLFARRIAPGLAFAEDPRNGESFGGHRCRLVAEALLDAADSGIVDLPSRRACVRERFDAEGISFESPHLGFGTADPLCDDA